MLQAVSERANFPVEREVLAEALHRQYENLTQHERVARNIEELRNANTYTVCTAHQPNLLTGYLYFVYKIIHAVKLAEELNKECPGKHFVPVYYMGSEDNDLDELGVFRYGDRKFIWDGAGQTGAVGRMRTNSLKQLLDELFKIMGPPGENETALKDIISRAYRQHDTVGAATQFLVNELFGHYGLLVLDPDDRELKRTFTAVMKDDVLQHTAFDLVSQQTKGVLADYKLQASPRHINLFYLTDNSRERIERQGDKWVVLNTDINRTETELLQEIDEYPERFSPNVILRGMYQETILPNVAFIGGGAEVAYWLQLKSTFDHYKVFYPSIQLRQSVLWVNNKESRLREQLGFSIEELFTEEVALLKKYIVKHSTDDWQTVEEEKAIEQILLQLKGKAAIVDSTLKASAEAALAKMRHQLQVLQKKMLRAEKRKMQVQLNRISTLKNVLFPNNSLQERVENFMPYYLQYGPQYFDALKDAIQVWENQFAVIESNG